MSGYAGQEQLTLTASDVSRRSSRSESLHVYEVVSASGDRTPLRDEAFYAVVSQAFKGSSQARLALAMFGGLPQDRPDLYNEILRRCDDRGSAVNDATAAILELAMTKFHQGDTVGSAALTMSVGITPLQIPRIAVTGVVLHPGYDELVRFTEVTHHERNSG